MNQPVIPPTPEEAYLALPYRFSLEDLSPATVVRIPIVGPEPFNTLAYMRFRAPVGNYRFSSGKVYHDQWTVKTPLTIEDYDPDNSRQQQVRHSSTGSLSMFQIGAEVGIFTDDNTDFTWAVDEIATEARVDSDGSVMLDILTADRVHQAFAAARVDITSWVMFYERRAASGGRSRSRWLRIPIRTPNIKSVIPWKWKFR